MAKKSKKNRKSKSQTDDFFSNGEPSSGFNNLSEGTYEGFIKPGSAIIEPKESGGHKASLILVVTAPEEHEDKEQAMRCDLSTQVGVNIFLGQLELLGLDQASSVKEAAEALGDTDDVPVRFWVGPQQDEYPPKVRINERLEDSDDGEEAEEPAEDDYTKKDIKKMTEEELDDLAKELKMDPDDYETYDKLRKDLYEELDL